MSDYDPNFILQKAYALVGQKAVIVNSEKKILVLQRSVKSGGVGKWSLPGGALEKGEEALESLKREINEEISLQVLTIKPFTVRSYITEENDFVVIIGYECQTTTGKLVLNWEHTAYQYLTKEEALKLNLTDDGRFFIEHFEF